MAFKGTLYISNGAGYDVHPLYAQNGGLIKRPVYISNGVGWDAVNTNLKVGGVAPQNFILWSEEINRNGGSPWYAEASDNISSVVANQANDMNGQATLDQITFSWSNANLYQTLTSLTQGNTYRFSFEAKRGTASDMQYGIWDSTHFSWIVSATSYYAATNSTTPVRISQEFTVPAGCTEVRVFIIAASSTSGNFYTGRVQVEGNGSAYVLTEGSAV